MNASFATALSQTPDYLSGHVRVSLAALVLGVGVSLPLALAVRRQPRLRALALSLASVVQTIPGLALLALFFPILLGLSHLSQVWLGVRFSALGFLPALLALTLYAVLPILRNSLVGLAGVDADVVDAARGLGMTDRQILWRVEAPLAAPVILAGIRTAAVWVIGAATLATPVGQTTLGNFIFAGLQTQDWVYVLFGCLAAAGLALIADGALAAVERGLLRRDRRWILGGIGILVLGAGLVLAPDLSPPRPTYALGSKMYSEQLILSQLMADRLQAKGAQVRLRPGLGSTVILRALSDNEIDAYVEYSGTLWSNAMGRTDNPGRAAINAGVRDWLQKTHQVSVLGGLGFENAYALAMPRARAAALHVRSIADLRALAPTLRIGGDYEFFGRPEWRSITAAYGLTFKAQRTYQPSFMYRALASGDVDVIAAYSSDGLVAADDLVLLEDPAQAIPPYDALILLSPRGARDSRLRAALTPLVMAVPLALMQQANQQVDRDRDKQTPQAAAAWLWGRIIAPPKS